MSTYVNNLRLEEIGTGEASGTWGTKTNTNLELIGEALGFGTEGITTNADTHASTVADASADEARAMYIKYTGTLDSACTITIGPNTLKRVHIIENATSGSQNIIIKQGSGAEVTIPSGHVKVVYLDGAGSGAAVTEAFTDLNVTNSLTVSGTTPTLTIGDAGAEDTKIVFDGNAQDFYVALDDSADDLVIGLGSTVGTTPIVSLTEAGDVTLKSIGTGDNNPMVLTLQTAETDIAADDVIAKIDFQAPDEGTGTDAITVAASIRAVSEGDFAADNNATSLQINTAASAAAASGADGGRLLLDSTGNLFLKDLRTADGSSPTITLQSGDTDIASADVLGKISFQAPDEGTGTDAILVAASISAISEGDFAADNNATKLSFATGASETAAEKMSLTSAGKLVVSSTVQTTALIEDSVTVSSSSNATAINLALGSNFLLDLGTSSENTEIVVSNPAASGLVSVFTLRVIQDSSARTITWMQDGSNNDLVYWAGGTAPTLTATNNGIDYFVFITSDGGSSYYGFTGGQAMAIPT